MSKPTKPGTALLRVHRQGLGADGPEQTKAQRLQAHGHGVPGKTDTTHKIFSCHFFLMTGIFFDDHGLFSEYPSVCFLVVQAEAALF